MEFYSDQIIDPKFGTVKLGDLTWQSSSLLELKIKLGNFKNYPDPVVRWTFVVVVRKWIEKR